MAKRRERAVENPIDDKLIRSLRERPVRASSPGKGKKREDKEDEPSATAKKLTSLAPRSEEKKTAVQRTRWTPEEFQDNAAYTLFIGKLVGCKVTESDITRALWSLAKRAEQDLNALSRKAPELKRPPYADRIGTAEFEDRISDFLHLAFKRSSIED